ncbi:unnamed protein product [Paramecium sonneborni]|uniref:Tetratricopeptide repeat protein n=1 Tax=Paramecium sonneborni TaxID=65129 RepID=A0A8S1RRQ6_9CILI|nr:unnamed protein product [Paramecium sonneborni]
MTQQLQSKSKDYLTFNSQISIIKKIYSKENSICIQQINYNRKTNNVIYLKQFIIIQLYNILRYNQEYCNRFNQIRVIKRLQKYTKQILQVKTKRLNKEGVALYNKYKLKQAIEHLDKSVAITAQNSNVWYNKGSALNNLNKYQEAIKQSNVMTIAINPKYEIALYNKGVALHNLKKYSYAISFYDQALSIKITPLTLKLKINKSYLIFS